MKTASAEVLDLLDRAFAERLVIDKEELVRAASDANVGEDALEVMRELPEGEYTHEGLTARLEVPVREREMSREAGMSGHSEPGWRPPEVRRHPNR